MNLIRNARIVTATETFLGTLRVQDQQIAEVARGDTSVLAATDWQGDYLLPGLVEIHTDNLEKHLMPRPKVHWPVMPAILAHDGQVATAGITTVLDAIAIGDIDAESVRSQTMATCIDGLRQAADAGLLRVDHFLHLRLELAEPRLLELFMPLLDDPRHRLVSLMDHTPGQRQWSDMRHYRTYMTGKRGWSMEKVESMFELMLERQARHAGANRTRIVAQCRQRGLPLPLATHDDTTEAHVHEGVADGITISEFPTTMLAARTARQHGLSIVMGAPNMVRGGSHSGNVSAAELAQAGLLDVLSSDYVPASLLHAAFLLQESGFSLPQSVAVVSRNPARMVGLADRGEIAPQLRADFIRVRMFGTIPVALETWKAGRQIA
ncbi:MAG: alpha-D-ribose 1-methylphosphonate 5-triphosphate diphosphatase [Herminiimonas sp.]|nr:alpha-D-ribose 1-methylphosphonate 5-triphosphate diphosphatase [Herminiimonas sp.]